CDPGSRAARVALGPGSRFARPGKGPVLHDPCIRSSPIERMWPSWARVAALVDTTLVRAIEILAAALVAIETVILFAGVVSRYIVHRPLTWSDELAAILFLWL